MVAAYIDPLAAGGGNGDIGTPFNSWNDFLTSPRGARDMTGEGEQQIFVKGTITDGNVSGNRFDLSGFTNTSDGGEPMFFATAQSSTTLFLCNIEGMRITGIGLRVDSTADNRNGLSMGNFGQFVDGWIDAGGFGAQIRSTSIVRNCIINCKGAGVTTAAPQTGTSQFNTFINKGGVGSLAHDTRSNNMNGTSNVAWGSFEQEYPSRNYVGDGSGGAADIHHAGELLASAQAANIAADPNYVQLLADPFADSANGDYSPASGGALDGAGAPGTGILFDMLGNPRSPTAPSIGALEVSAAVPVPTIGALNADAGADPTQTTLPAGAEATNVTNADTGNVWFAVYVQGNVPADPADIKAGTGAVGNSQSNGVAGDPDASVVTLADFTGLAGSTNYELAAVAELPADTFGAIVADAFVTAAINTELRFTMQDEFGAPLLSQTSIEYALFLAPADLGGWTPGTPVFQANNGTTSATGEFVLDVTGTWANGINVMCLYWQKGSPDKVSLAFETVSLT
jgi:hypothetical protein